MSDLRALIESGLIDKEDGTIFDVNTKLLWQQISLDKTFTWNDANRYCESLTLAEHDDWRLPTKEELETLINKKYSSTIDPIFKCKSGWYWSSSTLVSLLGVAWFVSFDVGFVSHVISKDDGSFVRAVRFMKE